MEIGIRDATVAAAGGEDLFGDLRSLGVQAVEIELGFDMSTPHLKRPDGIPYNCSSDSGIQALRDRLGAEGLRAVAILLATNFSGDQASAHASWTVRAGEVAKAIGAPVIRIDPLNLDKSLSADEVRRGFVTGVRTVLREIGSSSVDLGIENHGPIANDPAWLEETLREIDDPRVGLTLDTGNFYWYGFPLEEMYALLETYVLYAKHTHFKNINFPPADANRRREVGHEYKQRCCPLDEGNLDLQRVVTILRKAGYDRSLCIEDESLFKVPGDQKLQVLRREIDALKGAMR